MDVRIGSLTNVPEAKGTCWRVLPGTGAPERDESDDMGGALEGLEVALVPIDFQNCREETEAREGL